MSKITDNQRRSVDADTTIAPTTYFTFFSHRAQREYYYDPLSGVSSWQLPPQGIVSRLPGSPVQCPPSPQKSELLDLELLFPLPALVPQQEVRPAEPISQKRQNYELFSIITKKKFALAIFLMSLIIMAACFCTFLGILTDHTTTNLNVINFKATLERLLIKESRSPKHQNKGTWRVDESENDSDKHDINGGYNDLGEPPLISTLNPRHQTLESECGLEAEEEASAFDIPGGLDYRMRTEVRAFVEADVVAQDLLDAKSDSDPLFTSSDIDLQRCDSRLGRYELGKCLSDLQAVELGAFVLEEAIVDIDPVDLVSANGFISSAPSEHESIEVSFDGAFLMNEFRDDSMTKGVTDASETDFDVAMATAKANFNSTTKYEADENQSKGMAPVGDCSVSTTIAIAPAESNEPSDSQTTADSAGKCVDDGNGICAHRPLNQYRTELVHDENEKIAVLAEATTRLIYETSTLLERISHDARVAGFYVEQEPRT